MRERLAFVLMACAALTVASPHPARGQVDVNVSGGISAGVSGSIQIDAVSDFYQPLSPYGSWVDVPQYGRCWHPTEVSVDWQPYTVGSWDYSDAGWYWQSDEPWAWACYHYGSWYDEPRIGWVWVPGTEWAPAWVVWRDSDDYIGWAPCAPNLAVVAPSLFVFVGAHDFHNHFRSRHDFIVNNTTIINRTRVIKDFNRRNVDINGHERTIFANRGPSVDRIQRATGTTFTPRPVKDVFVQTHSREHIRREGEQRNEQQRHETPAPTGREQQRNYEQQHQNAQPQHHETPAPAGREQLQPAHPQHPAPTGREQQRNYQQQQQEQQRSQEQQKQQEQRQLQKTPEPAIHPQQQTRPEQRHDVNPPTGRETPRVYPETPKPSPVEPRHEVPTPHQNPVAPQERPLPPTGRNEVPHPQQPREVTPPQPREKAAPAPSPSVRPAPANPDGGHRQDGDGHNRRDGQ